MSSIISSLSSSSRDRTEQSNKNVALLCIKSPELLSEIAGSFDSKDLKLAGDCIEVFTFVSESIPQLITGYIEKIIPLLRSKNTRIRWEAMHTMALITPLVPQVIEILLFDLREIIINDKSVIVRDYAVKALSSFAGTDRNNAQRVFPVLIEILGLWKERHGAGIIEGLINLYPLMPQSKKKLTEVVEEFENSERMTIRKAVKRLKKILTGDIK